MEFSLETMSVFLKDLIALNDECQKIRDEAEKKKASVGSDRGTDNFKKARLKEYLNAQPPNGLSAETLKGLLSQIHQTEKASYQSALDTKYRSIQNIQQDADERIKKLEACFIQRFPPDKMKQTIRRLYSFEPHIENYTCADKMPDGIRLGDVEYTDLNELKIDPFGRHFLRTTYPFLIERLENGEMIRFPYYARFDEKFHLFFQYEGSQRSKAVEQIRSLVMRLFMMLPPGQARFVLIDPMQSGQTFSLFVPLVNENSHTKKIISDKILTQEAEIEKQMEELQNHIVYVTQNCLLGKYSDLTEYNEVSVEPEPYYFLIVMDFANMFTENALRRLEQIISGGPACGIYTILLGDPRYKNQNKDQSQQIYQRIAGRSNMLRLSECSHRLFDAPMHINETKFQNAFFFLNMCRYIGPKNLDKIKDTLKDGISKDGQRTFYIAKLNSMCKKQKQEDVFRVPIGVKGGLDVQYLTLGRAGVQNAMILGNIGIGKTNLLRLIILETLANYTPDEVALYLIDLKQGMGFDEFSNYRLPHIRAVTVDSTPAYCSNLLAEVYKEYEERSRMFTSHGVSTIEAYHQKVDKKLPRIVVIIDDLRQQFNQTGCYGDMAEKHIFTLTTLAKCYGIHLIMASQSFQNLPINKVYPQIAVRIAFFSDKSEANNLIANDGDRLNTLSINTLGKAIINEDCGISNHDIVFVTPKVGDSEKELLSEISRKYADKYHDLPPTRVLAWNIEKYTSHPFNKISMPDKHSYWPEGLLLGEPLTYKNTLHISAACNLLMAGADADVARTMFAFAILSLCMRYRIKKQAKPEKPFIYVLDCCQQSACSPLGQVMQILNGSYLKVMPLNKATADDILNISEESRDEPEYLFVFGCEHMDKLWDEEEVKDILMKDQKEFYTVLWHSGYKYMLEE